MHTARKLTLSSGLMTTGSLACDPALKGGSASCAPTTHWLTAASRTAAAANAERSMVPDQNLSKMLRGARQLTRSAGAGEARVRTRSPPPGAELSAVAFGWAAGDGLAAPALSDSFCVRLPPCSCSVHWSSMRTSTRRGGWQTMSCLTAMGLASNCTHISKLQPRGITKQALPSCPSRDRNSLEQAMAEVEREAHKEDCTSLAIKEASKSAGWALATSGILVSVANGISPAFQRALGVSGKAALVVRPTLTLSPRSSRACHSLQRDPSAPHELSRGPGPNWSPGPAAST